MDELEGPVEESKKISKMKFSCEICSKAFSAKSGLDRHKKKFNAEHSFHLCCNKVEVLLHECGKKKSIKGKTNVNVSENECGIVTVKQDKENIDIQDQEMANVDNNISVVKPNVDSDEDHVPDMFESLFKKPKRSYKRKLKVPILECVKCKATFHSSIDLKLHTALDHSKRKVFKCSICDMEFDSEEIYKDHTSLHDPEDKVVCKGCGKMFDTFRLYLFHAKQNPKRHCFPCKLCLRRFPSELLLEQHVCICINGKPFICGCGLEFTKYIDVVRHAKGTKPFNCCSCSHISTSLTAHLRHVRKHSKQKPFECSMCDSSFAVIDFLKIHMKKCHSEETNSSLTAVSAPQEKTDTTVGVDESDLEEGEVRNVHSCDECNAKFACEEELKKHKDEHTERVPCPDCGKSLKRNRLQSHRNIHKTSASLCPDCGKLFNTRFKLSQHMITTHYSEPVKCESCDKILKTKKIYNEHMKTHMKSEVGTRIPQAICPMCGLGLAQKGSLARHILLMHEKHKLVSVDIPHECKECGEICPNKSKYYSHRRMHRAMVDRFPCEICGRVFNKKQNLRRHIYLLHDEKRIIEDPIYGCQICTRSFREKKNLRRHYRMVHKIDDVVPGHGL